MSGLRYRDLTNKIVNSGQKYKSLSIENNRLKQASPTAKRLVKNEAMATKSDMKDIEEKLKHLMTTKLLAFNNEIDTKIKTLIKTAFDNQVNNIKARMEKAYKKQNLERNAMKRLMDEIVRRITELNSNPNSDNFYINGSPHLKDVHRMNEDSLENTIIPSDKLRIEFDIIKRQFNELKQENYKVVKSVETIKNDFVSGKDLNKKITMQLDLYKESLVSSKLTDTLSKYQKEIDEKFSSLEGKWKELKENNAKVKEAIIDLMEKHSVTFKLNIEKVLEELEKHKVSMLSKRSYSQDHPTSFWSKKNGKELFFNESSIEKSEENILQIDKDSINTQRLEEKSLLNYIKDQTLNKPIQDKKPDTSRKSRATSNEGTVHKGTSSESNNSFHSALDHEE